MRPQHSFWPSPSGIDAWDVERLIRLAAGLPVLAVRVDAIDEIDTAYWYGFDGQEPTVRSIVEHMALVRDADLSYPIILSAEGRVMDGMHRLAKALLEGRDTIDAVRFEVTPPPDHVGCDPEQLPC